jgi:hypothetical protein
MTDAEKQIREAAAAETRPGEWRVSKHREGRDALIYDADEYEVARVCYPNRDANAAFIAACNPEAIRELLAELDALKADAERLASLAWPEPFCDEYNGINLHEQATIYAWALGREEPNRDDYLAALRCAIDAAKEQR